MKKIMKHTIKGMLICFLLQSFNASALTNSQRQNLYESEVIDIQKNSKFYYKLGGSRPLDYPPTNYDTFNMGGTLKFGAGYSCGNFDPFMTIDNFMGDLNGDLVMNYAESAVTGYITGLPLLYLQRNHPDIYQMFQTNVYRAEEIFKFESKSCEQMESEIASGENPYKEWELFSQGENLQDKTSGNTPTAADTVMEDVKEDAGDNGITLPNPGMGITRLGGRNQDPIDMIKIGTIIGYNSMLQRPRTLVSSPTSALHKSTELVQVFDSPEKMEEWTKETIGYKEIFITDHPAFTPKSLPGKGLLTQASENQILVREKLADALNTKSSSNRQVLLAELASSGLYLTEDFANRINNNRAKPLIIDSLAAEIALNQEIDKALLVRRAMLTSISDENISASTVALETVEKDILKIENEIERAMFEYRLRKELVSDIAKLVYETGGRPVRSPRVVNDNTLPSFQ